MSELRTLWKHSRVFVICEMMSRVPGLVLIPIYAKNLTLPEFGIYALILVTTDLLGPVVIFGMDSALLRIFFDRDVEDYRRRVMSTTLITALGVCAIFLCLSYPLAYVSALLLFGDAGHIDVIMLALGGLVASSLFTMSQMYFWMQKRAWVYLLSSVGKALLLLSFNVYFIIFAGAGVAGIFLSTLITFSFLTSVLLVAIIGQCGFVFSPDIFRDLIRTGSPIVPGALFEAISEAVGRSVLNGMLTTSQVGIYSLGGRLGQLVHMFVAYPFGQSWFVRRHETLHDASPHAELSDAYLVFMAVLVGAALGLSILAPEILRIIATPAYAEVDICIPFLAVSHAILALRKNYEVDILQAKRMNVFPRIGAINLIINIVLTVALVRLAGILGAAVAAMLAQLTCLAQVWLYSRRLSLARPRMRANKIAAIYALAALCYGIARLLTERGTSGLDTAIRIAVLLAFAAGVFYGPIFDQSTRTAVFTAARLRGLHAPRWLARRGLFLPPP